VLAGGFDQNELPGLSQIWQSLSTPSGLGGAYGTGWPTNKGGALVSLGKLLAIYDNATVPDWWLEIAALSIIESHLNMPLLQSLVLELKRTFRPPFLTYV